MTLTITILDNSTGETEIQEVADNDYFLLCTGTCHVANTQIYPLKGTHMLTIKGQRARRAPALAEPSP